MMKKILIIITISFIFQGCALIKVSVSEKRNQVPWVINLDSNITVTSWGAIKINKSDFFPSSFQLRKDDVVVYIDPVEIGNSKKADYILISHSHRDHFSQKDVFKLLKPETKIICSKGVAKKLRQKGLETIVLKPNDYLSFDDLTIEGVSAYNANEVFLWLKAHPKSKENVGFVISFNDTIKIYHAGDTDFIAEMQEIGKIDLALVPIGGDNLTMNEVEAARMINKLHPVKVIPMHYEITELQSTERFFDLVAKDIAVIKLK